MASSAQGRTVQLKLPGIFSNIRNGANVRHVGAECGGLLAGNVVRERKDTDAHVFWEEHQQRGHRRTGPVVRRANDPSSRHPHSLT